MDMSRLAMAGIRGGGLRPGRRVVVPRMIVARMIVIPMIVVAFPMSGMIVPRMVMARVIMIMITVAGPVVVPVIFHLVPRRFVLPQQGGFEAELAQRILDFCGRGCVLGKRKVQPFPRNRHLDVGNTGQAGKCGFDLCGAAAAIHAADREGQGIVLLDARCCFGRVMTATG